MVSEIGGAEPSRAIRLRSASYGGPATNHSWFARRSAKRAGGSKTGRGSQFRLQSETTKNKHLIAETRVTVCKHFMNDILNKAMVLVLNRNWQAVNVRTPQEAFCMMATNVATGLEIEGENHIRPVTWEEWITLPIRDQDEAVHTVRGQI